MGSGEWRQIEDVLAGAITPVKLKEALEWTSGADRFCPDSLGTAGRLCGIAANALR